MRKWTMAVAWVVTVGAMLGAAAPAAGQSDTYSPAVKRAAVAEMAAVESHDFATAQARQAELDAAAKAGTPADRTLAANQRLNLEMERFKADPSGDRQPLLRAITAAMNDPGTSTATREALTKARANLMQPTAARPLIDGDAFYRKVKAGDSRGALADLKAAVLREEAAGRKPAEDYYRTGFSNALQAKLDPERFEWGKRWLLAYPGPGAWWDVVSTYALAEPPIQRLDKQQTLDVWRLLRAAGALQDKFNYWEFAQHLYDRGLPDETLSVLAEGLANGRIPADDPGARSLQAAARNAISQDGPLEQYAAKARSADSGRPAESVGDAYLGRRDFAMAVSMYDLARRKGAINADEVWTRTGIAKAVAGDKAGARAAFDQVSRGNPNDPRGDIADLWIIWLMKGG